GVALMPSWLWVLLGRLTGEIKEYMAQEKYEINQAQVKGEGYKDEFEFFHAYKKKCQEWIETGNLMPKGET
ncbi:unnamed protein product, partial [marine sediment metagenome]